MPRFYFDYLQSDNREVVITPLIPDYFVGLSAQAKENRNYLSHESFYDAFCSPTAIANYVEQSTRSEIEWFTVLGRGVVVGAIHGQYLHYPKPTLGVGYWIAEAHSGKGYAKQAVSLLVDFVFNNTTIQVADASPRIDNPASRAVLVANGFVPLDSKWVGPNGHEYQRFRKEK